MKSYDDKDVIPQNLFQHRISGYISGLRSNVALMKEVMGDQFDIELAPFFTFGDAVENMDNSLKDVVAIINEFVEFLIKNSNE